MESKSIQKDLQTFRKKCVQQLHQIKKRPELAFSLVAVLLLVVGVFAAVLLASVEQDIRQQAAERLYPVSTVGAGCPKAQQNTYGCIESKNQKVVCDGFQWRATGQACSAESQTETVKEPIKVTGDGNACGVDIKAGKNKTCRVFKLSTASSDRKDLKDASCVVQTLDVGEAIPKHSFASLSSCNSYLESLQNAEKNNESSPKLDEVHPDERPSCGGQAQIACSLSGEATCDTGYVLTEIGSCTARGATESQHQLFGICAEAGRSIEECEEVAFGGQNYLNSQEAQLIQDCVDNADESYYFSSEYFDSEFCRAFVQNVGIDYIENIARLRNQDLSSTIYTCLAGYSFGGDSDVCGLRDLPNFSLESSSNTEADGLLAELAECNLGNASNFSSINFVNCYDSVFGPLSEPEEQSELVEDKPARPEVPIAIIEYISSVGGTQQDFTRLNECITAVQNTGFSSLKCSNFLQQNLGTTLSGIQIAKCLQDPSVSFCPQETAPVAQVTIQGSSQQTINPQQVSVTVISIPQQIADCVEAGASEVDCRAIITGNQDAPLTGSQIAECIENIGADGSCKLLTGIQDISYTSCATLGACVEGRTCIYQGSNTLRNVGAACNDQPQIRSCEPLADQFSTNGQEGAPCCGGGLTECGSGICNAAPGLQGECTARLDTTSIAVDQSNEASVGITNEDQEDCSQATGLVQGTQDTGFVLKCDFDGNGSYGYHQPTGFVRGNQAVGVCQALCNDPTLDVEGTARTRYQATQIAVARADAEGTAIEFGDQDGIEALRCEVGTFESNFACVEWFDGVCVVQEDGCYREGTSDERAELCPKEGQSAYACSFENKETCLVHPKTGCYVPKTEVYAAEEDLAAEIEAGQAEIAIVSQVVETSLAEAGEQVVDRINMIVSNIWGSITGNLFGGNAPAEDVEEVEQIEIPEIPVVPAQENQQIEQTTTTTTPQNETSDPQPLNGGVGITNGAEQNNGHMQVEAYCRITGNGKGPAVLNPDESLFICQDTTADGRLVTYPLAQNDYNLICSLTYGVDGAVALPTGTNPQRAHNWICYPGN